MGIRRTSWPSFVNSRAQWCDVAQASMPTRQGARASKNAVTGRGEAAF